MKIEIELPEGATMGHLRAVQGAIFNASTEFVDWERLHQEGNDRGGGPDAISPPGRILLDIAHQLETRV